MRSDLNDFYPTSNLPRLYRSRARQGDEQRAVVAAMVTLAACQRSIDLRTDNEWTRQTLLGAPELRWLGSGLRRSAPAAEAVVR